MKIFNQSQRGVTKYVGYHWLVSNRGGLGTSQCIITHIVRKNTPSFTKSVSLVLIGQILKNIQPFKNLKNLLRNIWIYIYILIITGVQASGVIIDRLLRQCCFVWSEIVGPHSSGNFNDQRYIYI